MDPIWVGFQVTILPRIPFILFLQPIVEAVSIKLIRHKRSGKLEW